MLKRRIVPPLALQLAVFYPFFRGHAHLESPRREPYLFGEPYTTHLRNAIRSRYALLPYMYTLFRHANTTGVPLLRPLWYEFPDNKGEVAIPLMDVNSAPHFLLPCSLWYEFPGNNDEIALFTDRCVCVPHISAAAVHLCKIHRAFTVCTCRDL
eukprot:1145356-Pelagomonas_calceolata.AAC.6